MSDSTAPLSPSERRKRHRKKAGKIFPSCTDFEHLVDTTIRRASSEKYDKQTRNFFASFLVYATVLELAQIVEQIYLYYKSKQITGMEQMFKDFMLKWIATSSKDLAKDRTTIDVMLKLIDTVISDKELQDLLIFSIMSNKRNNITENSRPLVQRATNLEVDIKSVLDISPRVVAEHITMIEWNLFAKVHSDEFFKSHSNSDEKPAPNLTALQKRFDQMSFWVASSIITAHKAKRQTRLIEQFIAIIGALIEIQNFNSAFQLLSGLNLGPVSRLKRVWKKLPPAVQQSHQYIQNLFDSLGNNRNYRAKLVEIEQSRSTKPILPIIVLFLKDITFAKDGNQDFGSINLNKMDLIADQITRFKRYQKYKYTFETKEEILVYFSQLDGILSEDDLYEISTKIEPPQSSKPKPVRSTSVHQLQNAIKVMISDDNPSTTKEKSPRISVRRARSLIHAEKSSIQLNISPTPNNNISQECPSPSKKSAISNILSLFSV